MQIINDAKADKNIIYFNMFQSSSTPGLKYYKHYLINQCPFWYWEKMYYA